MAERPPFNRRSFLSRILGTTALGGATSVLLGGASARQVTDSDPTDPVGGGRGGTRSGITDSDPTDPIGGGRGATGYGDQPGATGVTDSDPSDRVGYGRGTAGGAGQYTGVTDSDSGAGADRGGYGRGTGAGRTGMLRAILEYPRSPFVLTNQELPSQLVNIVISGWARNTSTPIQVIMPDSLDMSGNHPNALPWNGVQVQGAGSSTTYTWDEPFRWSLLVFSCPGQSGTGASCYGARASAVPGSFRIPIIVQQGDQVVNLILMGTLTPHPPVRRG